MSKLPLLLGFYMPGEAEWAPAWLWAAAAYARNPAISQGSAPQFREWQFYLKLCSQAGTLLHRHCAHVRPSTDCHWEILLWPRSWYRALAASNLRNQSNSAHSKDQRRLSVMPGTPLCREALVWGIHTCVLNSCLWTPAGDLGCGCGNGSGGACAGLGTWSETSAVHGKLTSSASASYPETVIWRGHRLPQTLKMGHYIPSVHPRPSDRATPTPSISPHPLSHTPPTQKANHPQGDHTPSFLGSGDQQNAKG